ncbi:U-box domain-containing protein 45 [Platanthera guangdongensis]|uniref:RING-type E3 ubiquitin transferase n=1 Tax=Platanthera guangdongensis TaxID=2320717 RepID=A0ABR2LKF5_9ASPA
MEIVDELEKTVFTLDRAEKKVGDDVISLLQREKNSASNLSDSIELEVFHQAVLKLGITSSRAALSERRALKKLIERALAEEDKRKESIVSYLLHLTRKYSKLFRSDLQVDSSSQESNPCSPTIPVSSDGLKIAFGNPLPKLTSFTFESCNIRSGEIPIPPEEFRCPISSQLMHDPVIISSGQTYERVCIEKWFKDGHNTCPKTQQKLTHFLLTPNFGLKGLIASWCQHNSAALDLGIKSCDVGAATDYKSGEVIQPEESGGILNETIPDDPWAADNIDGEDDEFESYESLLEALCDNNTSRSRKHEVVEKIRFLLKDDGEARIYMGASRFVEALVQFLKSSAEEGDMKAQEVGALALFNLALHNDRNKDAILSAGVIPLLDKMMSNLLTRESATALCLNLSCLERAKPAIGSSPSVSVLVQLLSPESSGSISCKQDALFCLFNLSSHTPSIDYLVNAGIIDVLHFLFSDPAAPTDPLWSEKALAALANIASWDSALNEMVSTPELISSMATALIVGHPAVQEQAMSCLLILCDRDEKCCRAVLQEGVIPTLVFVSAGGTPRGRDKAQRLLKLFRERRQQEPATPPGARFDAGEVGHVEKTQEINKFFAKSRSVRIARTFSSFWKTKNLGQSSFC